MTPAEDPTPDVPDTIGADADESSDRQPAGNARAKLPFPVVAIGGSAGGLEAFVEFFTAMPADSGAAFVVILHLPPDRESAMAALLSRHTRMAVREIVHGQAVEPNCVHVIRPGQTLTIEDGTLCLSEPLEKRGHRHPVDDFFRSLATEQQEKAIAIVMSGMGANGSAGAEYIKAVGGLCIAQSPESAKFPSMPRHLINAGLADFVLAPAEMPEIIERYTTHPYTTGEWEQAQPEDPHALREILALIRARVGRDFTGYKHQTLLRRIERRMGLMQITSRDKYARHLRGDAGELEALSDDLMIHVTGFFRDPDAWDVLQQKVILPMLAAREDGQVRAWVTACSSGEEAYTLAILLLESAAAVNRDFDIKIFATDTAERSLAMARAGDFPAGVESEISAARLARFFDKRDATYRVKKEVRELVVFAPQNLLSDPPFSRLDICTCRNLLIYLRPETQRRAIGLLHFALRENGALFLGTSETVSDSSNLFEAIDKKQRIYRRVGATRHGSVEFPLLRVPGDAPERLERAYPRVSWASVTSKALLDRYTPPSVVIDREQRILYYHGRTERYLNQPNGEPTRDIVSLARDSIRGTLRSALQQAARDASDAVVTEAWRTVTGNQRCRTVVTVAPLEQPGKDPHYLVSFREEVELDVVNAAPEEVTGRDYREVAAELQRVRDELEGTVAELHARNEDLKAAHEEATSVNEEMQSTNEELETSKEELQSLNEELVTINGQLQLKMEELESSTNDLSSLLSSTTIAVIFLDPELNVRRFTPAVRDLIDFIPADVGRPIRDLARKFSDDALLADARLVIQTLVPIETEVEADSGRVYTRRALPYRTLDNRIDGVVLTFVDITERSRAVQKLRESEEQNRLILEALREYGIFLLDATGHVTSWTPGAARVLGYSTEEALGRHLTAFMQADDDTSARVDQMLRVAQRSPSVTEESWHVRSNGQRFWGSGMLAALHDQRGALIGYVKVLRDNTDRKLNEEALSQAKQAAESANDAKDRFLANVSHELRTPLSAILLWSSLLQDRSSITADQMNYALATINRSAEEQRELVEDLVDTSRIAAGKLTIDIRDINLPDIIERGVAASQRAASDRNITLATDVGENVRGVRADASRLQQVVSNLVSNAVKFSPPGATVHIHASRTADQVEIAVTDEGIGITPEFLPHVFDRFSQVRNSSSRSSGGLGLGLAIAKHIVELHGGTVSATSQGVGKGATFSVSLVLPPVELPPAAQRAATASIAGLLSGVRVLLVEDIAETREALKAVLHQAGAIVSSTAAAQAAYEVFRTERPHVILSDLGLPDVDGFAFISRIREMEQTLNLAPVPAVALTAFAGQQVRKKAVDSGFQLCLTKPIQPQPLVDALHQQLGPAE